MCFAKTFIFAENLTGINIEKTFWMSLLSDKIINWYKENKRDLPWRNTKNPYKIWISEIILQQTRVAQGYDYYCRFIERFPDFQTLADADEDEVMKYWQGLGYYSRARNLHKAARSIAREGAFPDTYAGVRKMKGVGDYTAAAICSFAYDMPCAVVDGNVYRVISRWMGVEEPIDTNSGKKLFAELADELLDKAQPALYNQAIMDFGALQCVPSSPSCLFCPLSDSCVALQKGIVNELPCKKHKTKVSNRYFHYFYVRAGAYTYIYKRGAGDIWHNLYEFPLIETEALLDGQHILQIPEFERLFGGCQIDNIRLVAEGVKHVLSHRIIYADCYEVVLSETSMLGKEYQRVLIDDLHKFPVSRLTSRFFSLILKPNI